MNNVVHQNKFFDNAWQKKNIFYKFYFSYKADYGYFGDCSDKIIMSIYKSNSMTSR